jgi:hypothetical protein
LSKSQCLNLMLVDVALGPGLFFLLAESHLALLDSVYLIFLSADHELLPTDSFVAEQSLLIVVEGQCFDDVLLDCFCLLILVTAPNFECMLLGFGANNPDYLFIVQLILKLTNHSFIVLPFVFR